VLQALIFDFDGLILDTESSLVEAWREIYDEYSVDIPLRDWAKMLGQSADPPEAYHYLEAQIGKPVDRADLKTRRIKHELALLRDQAPLPGVTELIQEAKKRGLSLAVASSSEHEWVDDHLTRLGLIESFDAILCADDVHATKPAPDLYLQALQTLGLHAQAALALEDSEHGVNAARSAGLFCIAVPNAITSAASFDLADVVLTTLKGVRLDDILQMVAAGSRT
jgi:HAD superfamily hydrolase (TIGR01509 family)